MSGALHVAVRHRFAGGPSLDLDFAAPLAGVTALFGPSGSGKSTLVQCVAGLLRPEQGVVRIGDTVLADARTWLPPRHRRIGLVFQEARLFPHLSVAANLRYGARRASGPAGVDSPGFDELVSLLGLAPLLARRPRTLSGGERQRVAIGRAILSRPLLLAMDEPLAALDDERRDEILSYLARLRARLALPILYVTHAMDEVLRLADTLVLLGSGGTLACGPVARVLADLAGPLAVRDDAACLLDGRITGFETDSGLARVAAGGFLLRLPRPGGRAGETLRLKIPAREVMLAGMGPLPTLSVQNLLACRVEAAAPDQERGVVTVRLAPQAGGGGLLLAQVTADSARRLRVADGVPMLALVKSVAIEVLA